MKRAFLLFAGACISALGAVDSEGIAFFEQRIRPVLVDQCYECHSATSKKIRGNLTLDSAAGWRRGGDSGEAVIVPGDPEKSLLIRALQHAEPDLEMPPKAPKLPDPVIADFVTWVRGGAPDPRTGSSVEARRADKSWWSLQPLAVVSSDPDLPVSARIDRFVSDELAARGLSRNPPAEARALIRRMSYDVIGLPPTFDEVTAFVSAHKANPEAATEALVDRLLASPHYGERWGRHWLDVIRFGESIGFERNVIINDLWPFRDYVIRSINEDKPFNTFIAEHLAGDRIGKDDPAVEVGTAFLVAGPYDDVGNQDPVAKANIRAATLDDIITATGGAFLGLTVHCARCHDHKFDPIPTSDYYRLRAAFEGVTHGSRVIASPEETRQYEEATRPLNEELKRLMAERKVIDDAVTERATVEFAGQTPSRPKIDPGLTEERFDPVAARFVKFRIHAATTDPKVAVDATKGHARLTEFSVWTAGPDPSNVALASHGGRAEGARSAYADDFPEAYGPQFTIDGSYGEQWFIGNPPELTITLARTETIERISFSNLKSDLPGETPLGATPCEYDIQVSLDGKSWRQVASSDGRIPWSPAHGVQRTRRQVIKPEESERLVSLGQQIASTQKQLDAVPKLRSVWAGRFSQPEGPTFVHRGGDPAKPGDAVLPSSLAVLDNLMAGFQLPAGAAEAERRLALARWITRDDNALALRVLANRVWHYHFGTGISDTPSDFGFLGGKPSHPALLDFLASRLLSHGWRLKPLHREILLSQTYRQSSAFQSEAAREDKDARLLWRFPPRRLEAEELRDTLLQVAGKLNLTAGGPGFRLYKFTQNNVCTYTPLDRHGPETYRRAVYHQNARASVVDLLSEFDLPDVAFAAPRRARTTSPMQALSLLNHTFTLDMAVAFAARVHGADPVSAAYCHAFQRLPTERERSAAEQLIAASGLAAFCRALLNASELVYID